MNIHHKHTASVLLAILFISIKVASQNPYMFDEMGKLPSPSKISEYKIRSIIGERNRFLNSNISNSTTEYHFDSEGNPIFQRLSEAGTVLMESRVIFRSDSLDIYFNVQNATDTTISIQFFKDKLNYEGFDLSINQLIKQHRFQSFDSTINNTIEYITNQSGERAYIILTKYNSLGQPEIVTRCFEDSTLAGITLFEYGATGRTTNLKNKDIILGTVTEFEYKYDSLDLLQSESIYFNTRLVGKIEYRYNKLVPNGDELSQVKLLPLYYSRKQLKQLPWYVKQQPEILNIFSLHNIISEDLLSELLFSTESRECILNISFTVNETGLVKDVKIMNSLERTLKSKLEDEIQQKLICRPGISGTGQPIELRISTDILMGVKPY